MAPLKGRGLCGGPGAGHTLGMRVVVGGTDGGKWVEYQYVQDLDLAGHDEGGIIPWVWDHDQDRFEREENKMELGRLSLRGDAQVAFVHIGLTLSRPRVLGGQDMEGGSRQM